MAHFAKLNENNIVIKVVVVNNETADSEQEGQNFLRNLYKEPDAVWKKCSYNTAKGKYYINNGRDIGPDQTKAFRKNFPGNGFTYDPVRDAFIEPKPFPSYVFNEETCTYFPPVPYPNDENRYIWNEEIQNWVVIT